MEEAYTALYQEFLRLQSLCLKQAAMLQDLTEALRRQQGSAPVSNGKHSGLLSIPVQCVHEESEILPDPEHKTNTSQIQNSAQHPRADAEIAGGMGRLQLDPTWGKVRRDSHDEAASLGSPRQQGALEPSINDELRKVEEDWYSSHAVKQTRRLCSSSFLSSDMLSQAGMLMSRVTLQSQVCEFCHAVFPGHASTRGEFLRHLNTHIS